ncbi:MAG: hypothetical protein AAGM38_15635 [Pseudomonadota bacterium]
MRLSFVARQLGFAGVLLGMTAAGSPPSAYAQEVYSPNGFPLEDQRLGCGMSSIYVIPDLEKLVGAAPNGDIYFRSDIWIYAPYFIGVLFARECAHRFGVRGEIALDEWAVCRGKEEGWLDAEGAQALCLVRAPSPAQLGARRPWSSRCAAMISAFERC